MADYTVNARKVALAQLLSVSVNEIQGDEAEFEVQPYTAHDGTTPAKAKELAELLRSALAKLPRFKRTKPTYERVRAIGYKKLESELRQHAPKMLTVGIHDVVNSLYFLCKDTDSETHAADHRDTLREAFQGIAVKDRTKARAACHGEYMVLTDDEADTKWDEYLDNYLDDCVLPELPESQHVYFDSEKWKEDAKVDGRGHCLNRYDGSENEVEIECEEGATTFYIYRTN